MIQIKTPQVKLTGIEYLLLSIQTNPGKSQRWYLRRKHMYQHGRPDHHKGGSGCGYFSSLSYRDILWTDMSYQDDTKQVKYGCYTSVNSVFRGGKGYYYSHAYKSSCSQMHLTRRGWARANEARKKIGLDPIRRGDD